MKKKKHPRETVASLSQRIFRMGADACKVHTRLEEAERRITACWNRNETIHKLQEGLAGLNGRVTTELTTLIQQITEWKELSIKADKVAKEAHKRAVNAEDSAWQAAQANQRMAESHAANWREPWIKEQLEKIEKATEAFFGLLEIQQKKLHAALEALK